MASLLRSRLALALALALLGVARAVNPKSGLLPRLYFFGDSTLDVGNNNYLPTPFKANFLPYGINFRPASGRFCNGRILPDYLAQYMNIPSAPPFLKPKKKLRFGVNFASAGAGALNTTFPTYSITLQKQIKNFAALKAKSHIRRLVLRTSLYTFSVGANDYIAYSEMPKPPPLEAYIAQVLTNIGLAIQALYEMGARKFLVFNLPNLACSPRIKFVTNTTKGCHKPTTALIQAHNAALATALSASQGVPNLHIILADTFRMFGQVLGHPYYYQTPNNVSACCGGPLPTNGYIQCGTSATVNGRVVKATLCKDIPKYAFWDYLHPSQRVNALLGQWVWKGPNFYVRPMNVSVLMSPAMDKLIAGGK